MHPHDSSRAVAVMADIREGRAEIGHRGDEPAIERLAGVGKRDAARRAVEQANADALLESAHHLAECRRRDAERVGGAREAERAGDGEEGAYLGEVAAGQGSFHC